MKTQDYINLAIKRNFDVFRANNLNNINKCLHQLKTHGHQLTESQFYKLLANGQYKNLEIFDTYQNEKFRYFIFIAPKKDKANFITSFDCVLPPFVTLNIQEPATNKILFSASFPVNRFFYVFYNLIYNQ